MGFVADAVGSVVEFVGDAISDVVEFAVDEIIEPVVEFVGDTISNLAENPISTIATIVSFATGIPLIAVVGNAAQTAVNGGSLGDVLKSAALTFAGQQIGAAFEAGSAGEFAAFDSVPFDQITAEGINQSSGFFNSALNSVSEAVQGTIGSVVSDPTAANLLTQATIGGGRGAVTALITGEDPVDAFVRGGLTAGVRAGVGLISEELTASGTFDNIPENLRDPLLAGASASIASIASTGELNEAAVANAVLSASITTQVVSDFVAENTDLDLSPDHIQLATRTLNTSVKNLVTGAGGAQNGSEIAAIFADFSLRQAADSPLVRNLVNSVKGIFEDITGGVSDAFNSVRDLVTEAEELGTEIGELDSGAEADRVAFNRIRDSLVAQQEALQAEHADLLEQSRLFDNPSAAVQEAQQLEADRADFGSIGPVARRRLEELRPVLDAFNAQREAFNDRVEAFNVRNEAFTQAVERDTPRLNALSERVESQTASVEALIEQFNEVQTSLEGATAEFNTALQPIQQLADTTAIQAIAPDFEIEEFARANNIDPADATNFFFENTLTEGGFLTLQDKEAALGATVSKVIQDGLTQLGVDAGTLSANTLAEVREGVLSRFNTLEALEREIAANPLLGQGLVIAAAAEAPSNQFLGGTVTQDMLDFAKKATPNLPISVSEASVGGDVSATLAGLAFLGENRAENRLIIDGFVFTADDILQDSNAGFGVFINPDGTRELRTADQFQNDFSVFSPDTGLVSITAKVLTGELPAGVDPSTVTIDADGDVQSFTDPVSGDRVIVITGGQVVDAAGNAVTPELSDTDKVLLAFDLALAQTGDVVSNGFAATTASIGNALGLEGGVLNALQNTADAIESTGVTELQNAFANAVRGGAQVLQSFNGVVTLFGVAPEETALGQFARDMAALGEATNTEDYKTRVEALKATMAENLDAVGGDGTWYERAWGTAKAIGGAFAEHPVEALTEYVGVELASELVPLAIGGGVSLGAKSIALSRRVGEVAASRIGASAGLTAATTSDLVESFGAASDEAFTRGLAVALASGMSEAEATEYAFALANKAGGLNLLVTASSLGIGGNAVNDAIFKNKGGENSIELLDAFLEKSRVIGRETGTESFEEGIVANFVAGQLHQLDPTIDITKETAGAITLAALVSPGTTAGVLGVDSTGDALSNIVSNSPLGAFILSDVDGSSRSIAQARVRLAELGIEDTFTQNNLLSTVAPDSFVSSAQVFDTFQNSPLAFETSTGVINQFVEQGAFTDLQGAVDTFINANFVEDTELAPIALEEGIQLSDFADLQPFLGQRPEEQTLEQFRIAADAAATNPEEARAIFEGFGFEPTEEQVEQFVGATTEDEQRAAIEEFVDPRFVDEQEVRDFFEAVGVTATEEDITQFAGQFDEEEQRTLIEEAADPRAVDVDEARTALEEQLGGFLTPTDEQIQQFVGENPESELDAVVSGSIDQIRGELINDFTAGFGDILGKPARDVTQTDIDFLTDVIAQGEALTDPLQRATFDINQDGTITNADLDLLTQLQQGTFEGQLNPESEFANTGLFDQNLSLEQQQNIQQQLQQQFEQQLTLEQQLQLQQQLQQDQQQRGADIINSGLGGAALQVVQGESAPVADIENIFDFSSILGNQQQASGFFDPLGSILDRRGGIRDLVG